MNKKNYTISVLEDYSRLDEIYRLAHDTFVDSNIIDPNEDGKFITCPHLDTISNTIILIAEQDNKIIGTISVTMDGPSGLHTDKWFKKETDEIRKNVAGNLASSWRIATLLNYRGSRLLVLDLILRSFEVVLENECDVCLFTFLNKHIRVYQRIIKAEIIKKMPVVLAGDVLTDLNLMKMDVRDGWHTFSQLRK